jgi:hypothetical protein
VTNGEVLPCVRLLRGGCGVLNKVLGVSVVWVHGVVLLARSVAFW